MNLLNLICLPFLLNTYVECGAQQHFSVAGKLSDSLAILVSRVITFCLPGFAVLACLAVNQ